MSMDGLVLRLVMPRLQSGGKHIILPASTLVAMCMHVYSCVYLCVHVCVHVCVHAFMCARVLACVLACVIVSILENSTFTYLHLLLGSMHMGSMHICVCIMHICALMHACVYTSLDHDMFLLTHANMW